MSRQGVKRERTFKKVRDFWESEARDWGSDPRVTIRDHYFRLLVKDVIVNIIKGRHKAIDLGCGTGFSSIYYAEVVENLTGTDYAESMIRFSKKFIEDKNYFEEIIDKYGIDRKPVLKNNLKFEAGDILDIKFSKNSFDTAITERVLVNLPTSDLQTKAITEVYRILQPKGIWVISEASIQGNRGMDKIRNKFGLPRLEKYWHNLYLDEKIFEVTVKKIGFKIKKVIHFETYQFLTRVVHPLVVKPKEPVFLSSFNNAARIVSNYYLEYSDIQKIGLDNFLKNVFRKYISKYDKNNLLMYDKAVSKILKTRPDFKACGNHILYHLEK